ncbi:MAG: 2-succinyl-5-enolpyruvyl-6-hydroxy-3-cyclohexene-1-carboxylic-acid synthase [Cyclobacteriaceae bacterium]
MVLQPVADIAEICHRKGIKRAIICPGSRNAPLTLAFSRHPEMECFSVSDERSAGFIALGMAMKSKTPVVLVCTSGSAAYNFAPAVAEAFFAQIPLFIITADRPQEWIGQLDGQTIYQENIFGRHVKKAFVFPSDYHHKDVLWHCHRMINESINTTLEFPQGPVHLNVPLREPFYPEDDEIISFSDELKITNIATFKHESLKWHEQEKPDDFDKILIIGGQGKFSHELNRLLSEVSKKFRIPVVSDIISNLNEVSEVITCQDAFLKHKSNYDELKPDLVITYGKSVISKNLKVFLRQVSPDHHWHIQSAHDVADTFQSLTKIVRCNPFEFFSYFAQKKTRAADQGFFDFWQNENTRTKRTLHSNLHESGEFSEFKAFKLVMDSLPGHIDLHLANSMAVRYANFIGLDHKKGIEVFANRGTSGIDGSVSTALGAALSTDREVYLLIGDIAFFYDRNGFWHNYLPANLKVILFNNHGGGIFGMIDGPSRQPELKEFFETEQNLTARPLALEFDLKYRLCTNFQGLSEGIGALGEPTDRPFILEIETDKAVNKQVYQEIIGTLSQFN